MEKFNQNSVIMQTDFVRYGKEEVPVKIKIVTTNKMLFIYKNEKLVGSAGVIREQDFNYDALLAIAKKSFNSSMVDIA